MHEPEQVTTEYKLSCKWSATFKKLWQVEIKWKPLPHTVLFKNKMVFNWLKHLLLTWSSETDYNFLGWPLVLECFFFNYYYLFHFWPDTYWVTWAWTWTDLNLLNWLELQNLLKISHFSSIHDTYLINFWRKAYKFMTSDTWQMGEVNLLRKFQLLWFRREGILNIYSQRMIYQMN